MRRTLSVLTSVLCAAALGVGCGDDPVQPTSPTPTTQPLNVTSISPPTGLTTMLPSVQVRGTGFQSGATLLIGDVATPANVVTSTLITATAPPHAAGTVDIVVTNPGGQSSRLAGAFTYLLAVTSLMVSGNTTLTEVGATSQLTATASFADGTTGDVTQSVQWSAFIPSVATVAPGGVLTARALGATNIYARHGTGDLARSTSVYVIVTPSGTFTASGRVRQPGAGNLPGVQVMHVSSGASVLTSGEGYYSFGGLRDGRLSVSPQGYEPVDVTATPDGFDDVPLQRVVRVAAGDQAVSQTLAPNDVGYLVAPDSRCQPCRLIRVTSGTTGTVRVRVAWTDRSTMLNVWVNGRQFTPGDALEITADVPVTNGVESVVYVGRIPAPGTGGYFQFTLAASGG